ncbi:MAG: palindromic element RPE2 domain-containing protein [Candidatus Tisiphia sp.]|nr:palindromic element RPE2 domain-containing protein [Candidatus Tisiphia sp.]
MTREVVIIIHIFLRVYIVNHYLVNSGEFGARNDGATPISNRRALSNDVTKFSSIDYSNYLFKKIKYFLSVFYINKKYY